MEKYRKISLLAVLAIFAWSTFLLVHEDVVVDSNGEPLMEAQDVARSLRHSIFFDPKTQKHIDRSLRKSIYFDPKSILPHDTNTTLTIHLIGQGKNPARDSLFKTDILERYSTGRVEYVIRPYAPLTHSCSNASLPFTTSHKLPCLVVFNPKRRHTVEQVKCNYPKCKTMVTNDEFCQSEQGDIREYYATIMKGKGYLPLGPRLDAWNAFVTIQQDPQFYIKSASERKYAFNAIFSLTESGRTKLGKIINEKQGDSDDLVISDEVSREVYWSVVKWDPRGPDHPRTPQLPTAEYVTVLLDSVFTLAPAGHNPECFRLYEAVESGSIPIILRSMIYNTVPSRSARCSGSLHDWADAPIVMLNTWDELYPKVTELMADLDALNEMQIKIRLWYDEHMRKVVSDFEDYMILSSNEVSESSIEAKESSDEAPVYKGTNSLMDT